MKHIFAIFIALLLAPLVMLNAAELKLPAFFSDHMVLQQGKPVPIWGWADPDEELTVELADQKKTARADATGKWMAKLDPLPASAEARNLIVRSQVTNHELRVTDVLVGEVWLGSGQSNMQMAVGKAQDFEVEKTLAELPLIRVFRVGPATALSPQKVAKGQWIVCSPESVGELSATLFFFGRELHRELKVPVGLINAAVGGSPIESWIEAGIQHQTQGLKDFFARQTDANAAIDEPALKASYEKALAAWKERAAAVRAAAQPIPRKPRDPLNALKRKNDVGGLFNGMIAPLVPYALRGVVWYQGEANAKPDKAAFYQYQLPLLVRDWRMRWGEELPFAWVQLPNINRTGDDWPQVREAMRKTLRLPYTGMAITVDIGDPDHIHPKNKQEVGRRLSLWALGDVYGQKVSATSGPLPAGHEVCNSEWIVNFKHTEGGLVAKNGELKGFVITGEDRRWKIAQARIEGSKVFVSSPDVKAPVAVRYAWESNPQCNLFNGAGLPASPFCTDDWR